MYDISPNLEFAKSWVRARQAFTNEARPKNVHEWPADVVAEC